MKERCLRRQDADIPVLLFQVDIGCVFISRGRFWCWEKEWIFILTGSSTIDSLVISAPFIVVHGADPPGDLIKEFVTKRGHGRPRQKWTGGYSQNFLRVNVQNCCMTKKIISQITFSRFSNFVFQVGGACHLNFLRPTSKFENTTKKTIFPIIFSRLQPP